MKGSSRKVAMRPVEVGTQETDTEEKGERLFDAKRAVLYDQSCDDIDSFARDIETQIQTEPTEVLKDLTSVKIMMQKQQLIETQFRL